MSVVIQIRRDTRQRWVDANPILASGELGYVLGENDIRIGDGVTRFNSLKNILETETARLSSTQW